MASAFLPTRSKRFQRGRGFTLLEMLVSLVIVALIMALAMQVLLETQIIFKRAENELGRPVTQLFTRLLRRDAQGSKRIWPSRTTWTIEPLMLEALDGTWVRYERDTGQVIRVLLDKSNQVANRRTLLRDVTYLQWKQPTAGLLEVEIGYRRPKTPDTALAPGLARLREGGYEVDTLSLRFALRALPGKTSW